MSNRKSVMISCFGVFTLHLLGSLSVHNANAASGYSIGVVTGRITDTVNKPVAGATVSAYDSDTASGDEFIGRTSTDSHGNYTIRIPKRDKNHQWDGPKTSHHTQWRPDIYITAKKAEYESFRSSVHSDHKLRNNLRINGTLKAIMKPLTGECAVSPPVPGDNDCDGIDDRFEDTIARKYAPLVRLAPSNQDWTRPANVDWYLAKAQLRFENTGACNRDDLILKVGEVNQRNLTSQSRRDKQMTTTGCKNAGARYYSSKSSRFFLQPPDDKVHRGAPASQWKTYVHVTPSRVVAGGYDIEYWFFYAYNDSFASFNHEADWERVTVRVNRSGQFIEADFGQHNYSTRYPGNRLTFVEGTHPVVYSADGSHASYPRAGSFDIKGAPIDDHTYDGGPEWKTWQQFVNVGEKGRPLNGQAFIQYAGRWGEIGETRHTSGPLSPSFQSAWGSTPGSQSTGTAAGPSLRPAPSPPRTSGIRRIQ